MLKHKFSGKRRAYIVTMRTLMTLAALLTAALVLFMIGYVLYKGLPNVTWKLLSTKPSYLTNSIGILPDILNTLYIVLASLVYVLPLGVGAAIYLIEYASNKKLVAAIEYAAETLSGIPSIIYGLVGMLFFCQFLGMQTSLMAGALTLVIMNLPTIMRTTQESLKTVPQSYREGAFGLGAGKWRVIRTVVLPGCVDGVITGCILSVGRILGETAALFGAEVSTGELFTKLYQKSLEGEADCSGVLTYNYMAGEGVTHLDEGRPMIVRRPESRLTLANFLRSQLYATMATLKIGMDILAGEHVAIDSLTGHGGLFKTPVVGQKYMAAACRAPVTCMESAGEGGPYGMALLASYMVQKAPAQTLEQYLETEVFADVKRMTLAPDSEDAAGFDHYLTQYRAALAAERAAVEAF